MHRISHEIDDPAGVVIGNGHLHTLRADCQIRDCPQQAHPSVGSGDPTRAM